jgi:hypothetical protein
MHDTMHTTFLTQYARGRWLCLQHWGGSLPKEAMLGNSAGPTCERKPAGFLGSITEEADMIAGAATSLLIVGGSSTSHTWASQ